MYAERFSTYMYSLNVRFVPCLMNEELNVINHGSPMMELCVQSSKSTGRDQSMDPDNLPDSLQNSFSETKTSSMAHSGVKLVAELTHRLGRRVAKMAGVI